MAVWVEPHTAPLPLKSDRGCREKNSPPAVKVRRGLRGRRYRNWNMLHVPKVNVGLVIEVPKMREVGLAKVFSGVP